MRIDYSEKKGGRDNLERKPVQKNRPRKEPVGVVALLSVATLLATFGTGVATGWFMFKASHKVPAAGVAQPAKREDPALLPAKLNPAAPDAPLTFYKTLPAGGKGVMGSGLNLKKPAPAATAPHPAPVAAQPTSAAAAQEKPEASARFVVQIASYRDKQEAERAQAKLSGHGVAAYVLESKFPDDTVWYRIRVGRHLSKTEAEELAAKTGKGAVVLAE
jgi:cell division protein FtsN